MSVLAVKANNKRQTQLCLQTLYKVFCDTNQNLQAHISLSQYKVVSVCYDNSKGHPSSILKLMKDTQFS